MTTSTKITLASALMAAAALAPAAAFAQSATTNTTSRDTCLLASGIATDGHLSTVAQFIAFGDCEIGIRDGALTTAQTRVQGLQHVSATTQASLVQTLQSTVTTLAGIKTTLDADTASTTARSDMRSVFGSVRVFALVLPRTWIVAASDRVATVSAEVQTLDATLITANASASTTVQAANAPFFADITAKLADAGTNATNAENSVLPLVPDQGNATLLASNTATILAARAMLTTAHTDLQAVVTDLKTIKANLKI